jgi:hypothetical protein
MNFLSEIGKQIVPYLTSTIGELNHTILVNVIGAISILFLVLSFQMKDRLKILLINFIGALGWTIYFVLMGDLTSALVGFIGLTRTIIFSFREKHAWAKSPLWLIFFLAISIFFGVTSFSTWKDLFSITAGLLSIISFYCLSERKLRLVSVGCYSCWLANSIAKGYVIALISDVLTLASVILALIRYERSKRVTQTF